VLGDDRVVHVTLAVRTPPGDSGGTCEIQVTTGDRWTVPVDE